MGLGCFAVPIVIVLVLAVLGFAIAGIFQGLAAASTSFALLAQTIVQPIYLLLALAAGAALGAIAAPLAVLLVAWRRGRLGQVSNRLLGEAQPRLPPRGQGRTLPGARAPGNIVRQRRRPACLRAHPPARAGRQITIRVPKDF